MPRFEHQTELKISLLCGDVVLRGTYWTNSEIVLEYNYRLGTQQSLLWPINSTNSNCNTLSRAGGGVYSSFF